MTLIPFIKEKIECDPQHSISFHDFMELALYHPVYGYYNRAEQKVGKEGDFYTNASVGSVFGEVLADIMSEMVDAISGDGPFYLIEFGAGKGELMQQILGRWRDHYPGIMSKVKMILIDRSVYHQEVQRHALAGYDIMWVNDFDHFIQENGQIQGVVLSNELIDAMPVHLLEWSSGQWWEVRVTWDPAMQCFSEVLGTIQDEKIITYIQKEASFVPKIEGYRLEANIAGLKWLESVSRGLSTGYIVTIDYGFARENLYIPERRKGSIMSYRKHQAFEDALQNPGEMDITSHVNFSVLMEVGKWSKLDVLGLFSQSEFLVNGGILDKLMNHQEMDPFNGVISKRNRAIRQLIMPEGMGQTFKVLVQAKGDCSRNLQKLTNPAWISGR